VRGGVFSGRRGREGHREGSIADNSIGRDDKKSYEKGGEIFNSSYFNAWIYGASRRKSEDHRTKDVCMNVSMCL